MGISAAGVGSGLDVASLVSKLMAFEQRPLDLLKTRETTYQNQVSALGQVKSVLDQLRTAATEAANASAWGTRTASLADPKIATASATASAAPGAYALKVTTLASAHRIATQPVAASTTVVGTGTLTLEVGSWAGALFTPKAGTSPVNVTIAAGQESLAGIRDAINAAGADATASIVTDVTGARLVLTSKSTGEASSLRVSVADDDGTPTDGAGLSALHYLGDTSGTAPGARQVQGATDAVAEIDGLAVRSATNTITGAIDGVTLNLASTTAGATTTLTVAANDAATKAIADKFVAAFNGAVGLLASYTKVDPTGKANGILQGDSSARMLLGNVKALATRLMSAGNVRSLSAAGITLGKDGLLALDATRFAAAIANGGTANVAALFSSAGDGTAGSKGIAVGMKEALDSALGADGAVKARTEGLDATLKANRKSQASLTARLALVEARLKKQYGALDVTLSQMQGIASGLTQGLDQVASARKAGD